MAPIACGHCFTWSRVDLYRLVVDEVRAAQYHLFFTNVVPHVRLDPLASCDEYELVKQAGAGAIHEMCVGLAPLKHCST